MVQVAKRSDEFWEKLQFLKITFWLTRHLLIEKLRPPEHMVKNSRDYFQLLNIHDFNYFNKNHKIYTTDAAEDCETCCANATAIFSELKDLSSFYSHFFEKHPLSQKKFHISKILKLFNTLSLLFRRKNKVCIQYEKESKHKNHFQLQRKQKHRHKHYKVIKKEKKINITI